MFIRGNLLKVSGELLMSRQETRTYFDALLIPLALEGTDPICDGGERWRYGMVEFRQVNLNRPAVFKVLWLVDVA